MGLRKTQRDAMCLDEMHVKNKGLLKKQHNFQWLVGK